MTNQTYKRIAVFSIDTECPFPGADEGTHAFLGLLDELSIPATFFIVGKLAEERPDIIDAIHAAGHEIACHAWEHPYISEPPADRSRFVDQLSDEELAAHCERCVAVLTRDGVAPSGFRAPWFRVSGDNLKVIGRYFAYDSSLTERASISFMPQSGLEEIPVSTLGRCGPMVGTPFLFGPGAMTATNSLIFLARPRRVPLMIYSHSFDLGRCPAGLYTNAMKRAWYFSRCGPEQRDRLARFLVRLRDNHGFEFVRCHDLPTIKSAIDAGRPRQLRTREMM